MLVNVLRWENSGRSTNTSCVNISRAILLQERNSVAAPVMLRRIRDCRFVDVPSRKRIKVQILFRYPDEANPRTIRRGNDKATIVPAKIHENQYEPTLREMEPV